MTTEQQPITHEDLVTLTAWMADRGFSAKTIAYAVEKPWKYDTELSLAKAVTEHEAAHNFPAHQCQEAADGLGWVCGPEWVDGKETVCEWTWMPPEGVEL